MCLDWRLLVRVPRVYGDTAGSGLFLRDPRSPEYQSPQDGVRNVVGSGHTVGSQLALQWATKSPQI